MTIDRTSASDRNGRRARRAGFAACSLAALATTGCKHEAAPVAQVPEVYVATVEQRDIPVYMELVGQTRGSQDVEIRARVEGYLDRVAFTEGTFVKKGQLLYQIDPKPFEASLARNQADLATARARLQKTINDVARLTPLAQQQAVSRQELDNAIAANEAAAAQVEAQKAMVEQAQIDLGYCRITSPIDGLVGTTEVKAGNLVGRGESTLLTTVSEVDPILFRAGVSEADYLSLAKRYGARRDGTERPKPEIELILADGSVHPERGTVQVIERAVDPTTGTLMVQFSFPNPTRVLRPGQYGRARFVVETRAGALLVPQRAVQELQNLYSVAVVGPDDKVAFKTVKVGPRVGSQWVIDEGLEPGARVVVEGLQRLRDGIAVKATPMSEAKAGAGTAEPAAGQAK